MLGIWLAVVAVQIYSALNFRQAAAIGIIGGADGPTSIIMHNPAATNDFMFIVMGGAPWLIVAVLVALAVVVTVILVRKKHRG